MSAGDVAYRINHRQDNESEYQTDANIGDLPACHVVDRYCSGPSEYKTKGAESFGKQLLTTRNHRFCSAAAWPRSRTCFSSSK